jgi:two-component system OmpR family sensor kinase
MDEGFLPHAFDRFARDPRSNIAGSGSGSGSGAGLGLAIVSAIVQLAGGEVRLLNRPAEGLRVEIELPFTEAGSLDDTPE